MAFRKTRKYLVETLDTTDLLNVVFFLFLTAGMIAFSGTVHFWWAFCLANAAMMAAVLLLADFASRRSHIWKLLHGFYMMIYIPIAFKEIHFLVLALHGSVFDSSLITIDRWLFGGDPTHFLRGYTHPLLTEVLQMAYASFYFLPMVLVVDLYRNKRLQAFRIVFLTVTLGFYLSYFGYLAVPAIGPRFTLHDFGRTDQELPGVFAATALRAYSNSGESIPPGTMHPERVVQRDCFPSGHTQVTLLVMFLAFRYRSRARWPLLIAGSLLIIATVYLRYHYVIDLIAGFLFAVLTIETMRMLDSWWSRIRQVPLSLGG
jgi:membrane-associated phospholipid phosphatase